MLAGLAGFAGYGDIETGELISYTYTSINNQTVIDTQTTTSIYSNNWIFTNGVPIVEFLTGLYLLIVLGVSGKENESSEK